MQGVSEAGGCCVGVLAADLLKFSLNRQNRIGLQEGRLVLVSPFYPEAGFNAGNAMGRNRYIYVLSDQALVIDSALRTGGTWEGAIENLKHCWVPMYVRSPGEGAGNAALIEQGGLPFTAEDANSQSLADVFASRARQITADGAPSQVDLLTVSEQVMEEELPTKPLPATSEPEHESKAAASTDSDADPKSSATHCVSDRKANLDMFNDFVSKLPAVFDDGPLTEEDLAARLHIEKGQAKSWLKRAHETGVLAKLQKPVRYVLGRQSTLC